MYPEKKFELFVTPVAFGNLTKGEITLLRHLIKCRLIKEIATIEHTSWRTKGNALSTLENKLQCHDKSFIIVHAIEFGYISVKKLDNDFFSNR